MNKNKNFMKNKEVVDESTKPVTKRTGKKPYKGSETKKIYVTDKVINDPTWYSHNPYLLNDSSNISWFTPAGKPYQYATSSSYFQDGVWYNLPSIMILHHVSSPGWSDNAESAMNVAARAVYTFVRHRNSGHTNYDYPDLALYLWAVDEIYAYIAELMRLYGVAMVTSAQNRAIPKALVSALGFDYDDIMDNLPNLRWYINNLVLKAKSLCVPNSFDYYRRHSWMYSHVIIDNPSLKAQLYAYVPDGYRVYNETNPQGGSLDFTSHGNNLVTGRSFAYIVNQGNTMINAILQSEDMNTMSGDILKAYGNDLFTVGAIAPDFTVIPEESLIALEQIKNSTIVGLTAAWGTSFDIYQDPNTDVLMFKPTLSGGLTAVTLSFNEFKFLSQVDPVATPIHTMELTRNTALFGNTTGELRCVGSDIITDASIWYPEYRFGSTPNFVYVEDNWRTRFESYTINSSTTVANVALHEKSWLRHLELWNQFRFHPEVIKLLTDDVSGGDAHTSYLYYDLDNFTVIHRDTLERMHETALLSMFAVPQIGIV